MHVEGHPEAPQLRLELPASLFGPVQHRHVLVCPTDTESKAHGVLSPSPPQCIRNRLAQPAKGALTWNAVTVGEALDLPRHERDLAPLAAPRRTPAPGGLVSASSDGHSTSPAAGPAQAALHKKAALHTSRASWSDPAPPLPAQAPSRQRHVSTAHLRLRAASQAQFGAPARAAAVPLPHTGRRHSLLTGAVSGLVTDLRPCRPGRPAAIGCARSQGAT